MMQRHPMPLFALFVALALSLMAPTPAHALSWPLCEDGGTVWVTERPKTEATFPGANLWFFCEGSLNVLGNAVSACVPYITDSGRQTNTSICIPQVAQAVCQLLGYEKAFQEDTVSAPAAPGEPVVTLTGEFCIRKGQYSSTLPDNLETLPGEPCDKITKLTCVRTLDTMAAAASLGLQEATRLAVLQATPAAEDLASTAQLAQTLATQSQGNATDGNGPTGRKLLAS